MLRRTPIQRHTRIKTKRCKPRRGPERNPDYLAFIREFPCVVCGAHGSQAAHTKALGKRGMGQKASDRSCLPLCLDCHTGRAGYHSFGRESDWAEVHNLDVGGMVEKFNAMYEEAHQ